jgi:hypothetical protein
MWLLKFWINNVPLDYFFKYEKWFFFQKNKDFLNYLFWMKSIKKKTDANFLLFVANWGKILFYILILIYFFKYETIVRFDVYACLDYNCWKRITVQWVSHSMTNSMFRIYSFIYENFLLAQGSVLVLCTKFNVQIGAGRLVSY